MLNVNLADDVKWDESLALFSSGKLLTLSLYPVFSPIKAIHAIYRIQKNAAMSKFCSVEFECIAEFAVGWQLIIINRTAYVVCIAV